jgi:cysteine desulfurase
MIYLNTNSTTKPSKQVLKDFMWCAENVWANPSDISTDGMKAKQIIRKAQEQIAEYIGAKPEEIVFTSGASESNNWAIKGFLDANNMFDCIITTKIEHPSVYNTCKYLEDKAWYRVEYAPVDKTGKVDIDKFRRLISFLSERYFCLVSIMMGNNEIGSLNRIKEIARITHANQGYLHVDAVQTFGHIPINVEEMGIDLMSVSFHKFGGLKNCGFLYIKEGLNIAPLIHGGNQFDGRRAGTENVPAIYALGNKVERMNINNVNESLKTVRDYLYIGITEELNDLCNVRLNGASLDKRLCNILSLTFEGINAEALITLLDEKGMCVSEGSACSAGEKKPSRVLKAIGLSDEASFSTVRISVGEDTTFDDCDEFVKALVECIKILRMI